jgi:TonB family protein
MRFRQKIQEVSRSIEDQVSGKKVMRTALSSRRLPALFLFNLAFFGIVSSAQTSRVQLEDNLKVQYAAIEKEIASPPSYGVPDAYRLLLRAWQDRLADRFAQAATTVKEILKLNPADSDFWQERLETLQLYSAPISSPDRRKVFGDSEVQKRATVIDSPAALYTDEANANKVKGEVRIRLVLSQDGTVRNIFPIKSLSHGLTESAMDAARQIKFRPAIRNGEPASQFATFVYEFKRNRAVPYTPKTVF